MILVSGCEILCLLCLLGLAKTAPDSECKNLWERVELPNATILSDGSAWDPEEGTVYPKGTHWKQEMQNGTHVVFGCPCRLEKPCLRKCCHKDQAMDDKELECIEFDEPRPWFRPNISIDMDGNTVQIAHDHFSLTYGILCPHPVVGEPKYHPNEDMHFLNLKDGTLNLYQRDVILYADEFCLEYFPYIDEYLPLWCHGSGRKKPPPHGVHRGLCYQVRYMVYPIAFSLSIFFLIVSLIVYCSLPELRNMHGKCLICYMACLLVAYTSMAAVQGLGHRFSSSTCATFGYLVYFALICTFFWLNILCIDMFLAFRGMQPARRGSQQKKKLFAYMAYAWGFPFIILLTTLFLEFNPRLPEWVLRPRFEQNCWIAEASKLAYFIIPMGIIVLCNFVLFLLTACAISRVKKETEFLTKGESKRHHRDGGQRENKARFKLYIKLSMIMGVSWISEIVSFAVGGSECYWFLTDSLNCLQGVFIFFITVCKKNVKNMLMKRAFVLMGHERGSFLQSMSSSGQTPRSSTK